MASKKSLRLRLALIAKFDQLSARLEAGDQSAIEDAHSHLAGLIVSDDTPTLALVIRAFARVLDEQQSEVDESGVHW